MSTTGHLPPDNLVELESMTVARVQHECGSHIEPELDPDWDYETKLRWHAAVTAVDTGLPVRLYRGGSYRDGKPEPNVWAVTVGRFSHSAMGFRPLWTFLNGVTTGAQAVRKDSPL